MSATVVICANPFAPLERAVHRLSRSFSIRGFLKRHGYDWATVRRLRMICHLNGRPLLRADWGRRLKRDDVVVVQALPAGGNGGGSQILKIVLMIAVMAAAAYITGPAVLGLTGITAGIVKAVIGLAFTALISFLIPAPKPASNRTFGDAPAASPTYSLQAQGNTARIGQPIPALFGRHRIFPDFVSQPYQSFAGNEQYLHYLLGVSLGEVDLETPKIGDTPIDRFTEVVWHKIEPGAPVPAGIADARIVASADVGEAQLPGSEAGSPWKGPFPCNPPGTVIGVTQADIAAPRGLYFANAGGGLDARGFTLEVEVQRVDDIDNPLGAWTALSGISVSMATTTPQRFSYSWALPQVGRWQMRIRRTDAKDGSAQAGHEVVWFGLRGQLTTDRRFPGLTVLAIRMRASGQLTDLQTRNINVVATRKLRTLLPDGTMSATLAPSRSTADAMAEMLLASYGGGLSESKVDLASFYAGKPLWDSRGYTFDGVFDTSRPLYEALQMAARTVRAVPIVQGGKVRLVRDVEKSVPVAMFTQRNILRHSFEIEYLLPTDETADAVTGEYMDPQTWRPRDVTVALPDSQALNPTRRQLFGVTNRQQARWVLWYWVNVNRYRRRLISWRTELEGLSALYGDPIRLAHDLPAWGQSAEATDFDAGTRTLEVTEPLTWTEGATHFVALRKRDGTMAGPFTATQGDDARQLVIGAGTLPTIDVGGDRERTHIAFGKGESWAAKLKIVAVRPRQDLVVELAAVDDDPRVYGDPPVEALS